MKDMSWKKWTALFIAIVLLAIAGYDVIAISGGGTEASISHMMITWSYKYPAFTFMVGFAMGHLFWRMRGTAETQAIDESTRK